jgi:uncharacterized membrane protein YhaH (DUF805 family)
LERLSCPSGTQILGYVLILATLVPNLAVGARRLHDTNRSGWWQLIGIIPIVGWILLIVWYATDGTPGQNEHGTNPKAAGAGAWGSGPTV